MQVCVDMGVGVDVRGGAVVVVVLYLAQQEGSESSSRCSPDKAH